MNKIKAYKDYLSKTSQYYNKNNSELFWGNIPSHVSDLMFLSNYRKLSFFDIGCGAGQTLHLANLLGFTKVSGLEVDKTLYKECLKNGFDVINENIITSKLEFLKDFDLIYFYCFIKEEGLKKIVLTNICNNMKIGSIIKIKLAKFDFENFIEIEKEVFKKITN